VDPSGIGKGARERRQEPRRDELRAWSLAMVVRVSSTGAWRELIARKGVALSVTPTHRGAEFFLLPPTSISSHSVMWEGK